MVVKGGEVNCFLVQKVWHKGKGKATGAGPPRAVPARAQEGTPIFLGSGWTKHKGPSQESLMPELALTLP